MNRSLARMASLLAAAAGLLACSDARAAGPPPIPGYVAVPLRRAGSILILETTLNGHEVSLQVDTGAPVTVLSQTAYNKCVPHGAETSLPAGIPRRFFANGQSATAGWVADLRAGDMHFGGGPVAVTTLDEIRQELYQTGNQQRTIEGLLGADVLLRYRAIIDPSREAIYFSVDSARKADVGSRFARGGWTGVPMSDAAGGHYCVPTEIKGAGFHVMVDTGASITVVDARAVSRLKLPSHSVHLWGQVVNMRGAEVKALPLTNWRLGGYTIAAATVGLTPLPASLLRGGATGRPLLGLLGMDVLVSQHAIIDLGGMKLYLKPS